MPVQNALLSSNNPSSQEDTNLILFIWRVIIAFLARLIEPIVMAIAILVTVISIQKKRRVLITKSTFLFQNAISRG